MTVVMAEHKVDRIAAQADKVLVLDRGQVVAWGPPGEVFSLDGTHGAWGGGARRDRRRPGAGLAGARRHLPGHGGAGGADRG